MKLITASALGCGVLLPFLWWLKTLPFLGLLVISLIPINLAHGLRNLRDFHHDAARYAGIKLMSYPPLIFGALVFLYQGGLLAFT